MGVEGVHHARGSVGGDGSRKLGPGTHERGTATIPLHYCTTTSHAAPQRHPTTPPHPSHQSGAAYARSREIHDYTTTPPHYHATRTSVVRPILGPGRYLTQQLPLLSAQFFFSTLAVVLTSAVYVPFSVVQMAEVTETETPGETRQVAGETTVLTGTVGKISQVSFLIVERAPDSLERCPGLMVEWFPCSIVVCPCSM